jgi:hypothetical protein
MNCHPLLLLLAAFAFTAARLSAATEAVVLTGNRTGTDCVGTNARLKAPIPAACPWAQRHDYSSASAFRSHPREPFAKTT